MSNLKHVPKKNNTKFMAGKSAVLLGILLLSVGAFVGFSYAQSTPGVSHAFDEIVWGTVINSVSPPITRNFLRDIKLGTLNTNGTPINAGNVPWVPTSPTHGLNADFF